MDDSLRIVGTWNIEVRNWCGQLKEKRFVYNTITTAGKAQVAALMLLDCQATATAFDFLAVGTGTGAPAKTQTALTGEVYRTAGAGTIVTSGDPNDTAQIAATFSITAGFALAEAGIFNSAGAGGGTMLCRATYAAINVTSGDTLALTYKVNLA